MRRISGRSYIFIGSFVSGTGEVILPVTYPFPGFLPSLFPLPVIFPVTAALSIAGSFVFAGTFGDAIFLVGEAIKRVTNTNSYFWF